MKGEVRDPASGSGRESPADRSDPTERTSPDPLPLARSPGDLTSTGERAADGAGDRFHLVVIGTGPVGKPSLLNALPGRQAGEIGATIGTPRGGRTQTYPVGGVGGTLLLPDTPGLGEPGSRGSGGETEALDLARRA